MSKVPGERSQICSKIPPPKTRTSEALFSTQNNDRNISGKEKSPHSYDASDRDSNEDNKSLQSSDEGKSSKQASDSGKSKLFGYRRGFGMMLPKININVESIGDNLVQNPRILDLRNKLNEINKKRERDVDKETKTLINDITQRLDDTDDQEGVESGPYSLLLDLKAEESTSKVPAIINESPDWKNKKAFPIKDSVKLPTPHAVDDGSSVSQLTAERKPNIITFEGKHMNEFEYSCETADVQMGTRPKEPPRLSSRSELCLHFNTQTTKANKMETISPTTDSSLHRPNEENSLDDSLGILTPDQMDDMFSPTVEGLPVFADILECNKISPDNGDTPSTDKTETNSAVSTMYMENENISHVPETGMNISQVYELNASHLVENEEPEVNLRTNFSLTNTQPETAFYSNGDITMMPLDDSALQFGEPENNAFFSGKSTDINKDKHFVPNIEDELLPSVHSSILDPVSSLVDTTINLELPLDSKHFEKSHASHRIEQTPSPEDLPLDSSDLNGEPTTYSSSQVSGSTLHDSRTFSDAKTDFAKSMEISKVSNSFITSITSITSLDGYQGDGEMSRPVSRGADQSIENREDIIEMDWQNVPVNRRPDPMTDSDFFTESDADGHDDHMHRGDRRAQVIDGALYGGNNNNGPLIVNRNDDSCMESSGVFTDLETHRCSPVFLNAIDDMSPDGSSPSTRSECSQKNGSSGDKNGSGGALNDPLLGSAKSRLSLLSNDDSGATTEKGRSFLQKNTKKEARSNDKLPKEEKRSFALKKYKMPKRDVPSKLKTMLTRKPDSDASVENSPSNKMSKKNERREFPSKKPNMSETKTKTFKDIKSKVDCCFALQRSQTACSVTRTLNTKSTAASKPKTRHMRTRLSELGSVVGSGKSSLHSSQSDISAASSPPGKHASARFPLQLARSTKKRETGAGVAPPRALAAPPPHAPPALGKRNGAALPKLPSSPVSARTRPAPAAPAAPASAAPAAAAPPASPRKPAQRRALTARPTTLPAAKDGARAGAGVRGAASKRAPAHAVLPPAIPAQPAPTPAPAFNTGAEAAPAAALAHAAKGVEALGVLVQYLVCQLESLNGDGWRAEAARWRGVAAAERSGAARASHDHQQRAQKDLDTIGECLNKISELEMEVASKEEENSRLVAAGRDAEVQYRSTLQEIAALAADIKGLKSTIGTLKREVSESRGRVCAGADRERTLTAQLEAARRDLADAQLERHPDLDKEKTELVAEVRSLRAVLELKQAETCELRAARTALGAEVERRAAAERELDALRQAAEELRERAAARQRDADLLRDDNRRLRECAARDQHAHARLALYNEELRYKLRQKSQVVSLLAGAGGGAGGAYLERAFSSPRARAASCGSGGSAPDSPSPADSPSPPAPNSPAAARRTPAVKGVVEKQDSVSWVLEIEESPEEVADRLARRSGSFRTVGSPGGVKRRGGGSPVAPGSPAPAGPAPNASKLFRCGGGERGGDYPPPPLKESAGEAIYIYDNRQY